MRILDFFDNNPLQPPPHKMTKVSNLNTGETFRNGYHQYVTNPDNQIGIGIQWYIDGAVTGQFDNLSVTALKMSLSCFTKKYRMKDEAWAILGFVVNYTEGSSKGKRKFADSQHDQAQEMQQELEPNEGVAARETTKREKAQDFHTQLATILEDYLPLEANGMLWDFVYRHRLYRNKVLVFWTVMVRCDMDEAELLCGKYWSRSKHVKQLCRYCTCPNEQTDDPKAKFPYKTMTMIKELVRNNDKAGLKELSQQLIDNALYKLRMNPGNDRGIHGACPSEMLHALLLGMFKYLRECLLEQLGPSSQLAADFSQLWTQCGELLSRQSERDVPNCKFSFGFLKPGKIMAHEHRGVLLGIAAVLRSDKGRDLLLNSGNEHFNKLEYLKDWQLLVESLLQWEAFLHQPEMDLATVERLEKKNRYIMWLFKKIGRRSKAMGLKLFKFHGIVHMADDIKLYGVPMEHDTGANESGHKETKVAAKLTQKSLSTFEMQTATRLIEFWLLMLAMAELEGKRLWEYYSYDSVEGEDDTNDEEEDDNNEAHNNNKEGAQGNSTAQPAVDNSQQGNETVTGGTRFVAVVGWR